MNITPEQARAELARRESMRQSPSHESISSIKITPEEAKQELARRQISSGGGNAPLLMVASEVLKRSPLEKLTELRRNLGGDIAEKGGEIGARTGFPKTGQALGVVLGSIPSLGPEILSAGTSLRGVISGDAPIAQAIRNTPKDLSKRYSVLNKSAGISERLPVQRGAFSKFKSPSVLENVEPAAAPASYPKDVNSFLNFAKNRLSALQNKLSPQELNDYKSIVSTLIRTRKIVPGTDQYAVASQVSKQSGELLGKGVPGRAELDEVYALSKKLRVAPEIAKKIWSYLGPKLRYGVIGVP